jgi:diguanylate cyclase (GGDEF)-like protein
MRERILPRALSAIRLGGRRRTGARGASLDAVLAERRRLDEKLDRLTTVDELTGLANRRGLREHFEREHSLVDRNRVEAALLVIDVDGTAANLNAESTDELVRYAAVVLRAELRGSDTLARLEGRRFAVILPAATAVEAAAVAAKLGEAIASRELDLAGRPHRPSAAAGVTAILPESLITLDRAIAEAEQALAAQKGRAPQPKK